MTEREAPTLTTTGAAARAGHRTLGRVIASKLVAVAAAGLILAAAGGSAQAATNNPGSVVAGWGSCRDTYVQVTVPLISPAPVQYGATPLFGAPSQPVAWRANLDQWIGGRWVKIRDGVWWYGTANASSAYGLGATSYSSQSGQPLPATIGFDRLPVGTKAAPAYFKVWYEFYWYPDQYRGEGRGWAWAGGHQENRGGGGYGTPVLDQTAYEWCRYPGMNGVWL